MTLRVYDPMESHKSSDLKTSLNHNNVYPAQPLVGPPQKGRLVALVSPTLVVSVALTGLFWWLFLTPLSPARQVNAGPQAELLLSDQPFSWSQIIPAESLHYHECFNGFQCARLDVPMDYHRPDGQGTRMAIAVTRLPAKVPVTDPRYGGPILINPGGPGGSGVTQVLRSGRNLQVIVDAATDPSSLKPSDPPLDRYFDIIGFDPRGVNNTTPGFSCFPDLFSQKNWELQAEAEGILGSSPDSFMRNWQRVIALNTGCSRSISTPSTPGGDALGEHTNTPPVARDMLEIVERHAEWREKEGLEEQRRHDRVHGYDPQQPIVARTRWRRGQEKLLYWGRSYGTVLGSTFAALFPDRVDRVLLDGVVDADKYYWDSGADPIADSDAIFDKFALYCDAAGEQCPLYVQGGSGAIKASYQALESALLNSSLAVLPSETRGPEVVTWSDLKTILRLAVYQPLAGFGVLADIATGLSRGNGSKLADFKHRRRFPSCPTEDCRISGPWSPACQVPAQNEPYSSTAILCSDAEYLQNVDQQQFKQYWRGLQELSSVIGDYWAHVRLDCAGWNVKPKWKMTAPVTGNTSHPLLFVSNILDPVTPLRNAKKMSAAFPGSGLLQQDSEGHCTLAAPSLCVNKAIRRYFQTGELPLPGTVCNADLKPFLGAPSKKDEGDMDNADRVMYRALVEEAQRMPTHEFPL